MLFVSMYVKLVDVDVRHMSFIFVPVRVLDLGPVSRTSRELFGPEKLVV